MQYLLVLIFTTERCLKKTIVERSIAKRVQLTRGRIAEIEEEKSINDKLFKEYFTKICTKNYARQKLKEMRIEYI